MKSIINANAAFESSPVHQIEARHIQEPGDQEKAPSIRGMTEVVAAAFEKGALFSEIGAPWAHPGCPVSTRGYDRFPAGFIPRI